MHWLLSGKNSLALARRAVKTAKSLEGPLRISLRANQETPLHWARGNLCEDKEYVNVGPTIL